MTNYYVVANGFSIGIFTTWKDCKKSIDKFPNAIYKKFTKKKEADEFLLKHKPILKPKEYIPKYYVYTDGACINNGKLNAKAGIGIYFGDKDPRNISSTIIGKQSNNTAELSAVIQCYKIIEKDILDNKNICIVTDSKYVINCLTSYGHRNHINNWILDIPNKELVKEAFTLYYNRPNVKFLHIMAHTDNKDVHSIGNYNADKLANQALGLEKCPYSTINLDVPFSQKDEIKKLGGKWNPDTKKWYIFSNNINLKEILTKYKPS